MRCCGGMTLSSCMRHTSAVVHPRRHGRIQSHMHICRQETLMQEGYHLEADTPGDDLTYKGVVFNEMKVWRLHSH